MRMLNILVIQNNSLNHSMHVELVLVPFLSIYITCVLSVKIVTDFPLNSGYQHLKPSNIGHSSSSFILDLSEVSIQGGEVIWPQELFSKVFCLPMSLLAILSPYTLQNPLGMNPKVRGWSTVHIQFFSSH